MDWGPHAAAAGRADLKRLAATEKERAEVLEAAATGRPAGARQHGKAEGTTGLSLFQKI